MTGRRSLAMQLLTVAVASGLLGAASAQEPASPRESVRLDTGWRFHDGDPENLFVDLRYDVLPEDQASLDGEAAESEPEAAVDVEAGGARLKPWILPSANGFIADPTEHHERPDGDPGLDVSFVQDDYDDGGWAAVTLRWPSARPEHGYANRREAGSGSQTRARVSQGEGGRRNAGFVPKRL